MANNKILKNPDRPAKRRTVQAQLEGVELEELDLVKATYGHKSDATLVRFLIHQLAQNIKNGKPNILIA